MASKGEESRKEEDRGEDKRREENTQQRKGGERIEEKNVKKWMKYYILIQLIQKKS